MLAEELCSMARWPARTERAFQGAPAVTRKDMTIKRMDNVSSFVVNDLEAANAFFIEWASSFRAGETQ